MRRLRAAGVGLCRAAARALHLGSRAFACAAPGLLSAAELRAAIARGWEEFGASDDYVLSGLHPWEQALYPRFLRTDDRVLVVGCGTGRDLIALRRAGYRADGLECASAAARTARVHLARLGLEGEVVDGSVESAALGHRDAVILSWYVYSYIPGRAARVAVLDRIRRHLHPGGRILLSYLLRDDRDRAARRLLAMAAAIAARSDWRHSL